MATATITNFTITKNVSNADILLEWTVNYDTFDQLTNLGYEESWKLIGDDTSSDGDDGAPGDDAVGVRRHFTSPQSSNGQASRARSQNWTVAWSSLNEDNALGSALDNDDEIRAVVTLEPLLPVTQSRESLSRVVTSP